MLKALVSTFAIALSATLLFAGGDKSKVAGPIPGDAAPTFAAQDQNGSPVNLESLRGKVVVLEWFNNECPYVVKHYKTGHMNDLAGQYADKGVVWLAINSTNGKSAADMKEIAVEWKISRPIVLDSDGSIGKSYGSKNTPTMYIIDKDGKVAYRGAIDSKSDSSSDSIASSTCYVSKALDEILAGKPVSEPMTKAYGC
ncbi:MAG: redoxin domain-containing protein, partial [Tepidisphaeraceae bacterium]